MKNLIFACIGMMLVFSTSCRKECVTATPSQQNSNSCWNGQKGWYEPCDYQERYCDYQQVRGVYHPQTGVLGTLFFTQLLLNGQQNWYGQWYPYDYGYRTNPRFTRNPFWFNNRNIYTDWYY